MLAIAAGVVMLSGASVVAVPEALRSDGLTARTVARLLADAVPDDAEDVRVNGVYGSAHEGTWQFVAHLTWRGPDGAVHGGGTELPQNGGQPPLPSELSQERLDEEHRIGWTMATLHRALRDIDIGGADLAMLELAIRPGVDATVVVCAADSRGVAAECTERDHRGRVVRRFAERLIVHPGWDAVSVQRESAPVTTPF
ncbi:MAG TPA: hypothetical protein VGX28_02280 [Frankiaceae bacterium]|jgi:hypothetical protein|nr:hypothetical protein [Frankiaceae bacterium]